MAEDNTSIVPRRVPVCIEVGDLLRVGEGGVLYPADAAPTWTRERPKVSGKYWTRWKDVTQLVDVEFHVNGASVTYIGGSEEFRLGGGDFDDSEWSGPLAPPE